MRMKCSEALVFTPVDGQFIAYTEAGYILTLNTTNLATSSNGAHIGDSSHDSFGWHDQDHNPGAFVTLTKVGGGVFNLISFDYLSSNNDMQVTANSGDTLALPGDNYQPAVPAHLHNVTSVSFSSTGLTYLELDNIVVTTGGVPEPATWATMLLGLGMVGAAVRRRQKVTVSFG